MGPKLTVLWYTSLVAYRNSVEALQAKLIALERTLESKDASIASLQEERTHLENQLLRSDPSPTSQRLTQAHDDLLDSIKWLLSELDDPAEVASEGILNEVIKEVLHSYGSYRTFRAEERLISARGVLLGEHLRSLHQVTQQLLPSRTHSLRETLRTLREEAQSCVAGSRVDVERARAELAEADRAHREAGAGESLPFMDTRLDRDEAQGRLDEADLRAQHLRKRIERLDAWYSLSSESTTSE